jgi:hypothetical protein
MIAEHNQTCIWSGHPFKPRIGGGKKQRFCCTAHRSRYWRALRKWASRLFDEGFISIDDLRSPTVKLLVGAAPGSDGSDLLSHRNVHGAPDASTRG